MRQSPENPTNRDLPKEGEYDKINLEKIKRRMVYHHKELALPVVRMVSGVPHNTDESAIHTKIIIQYAM